MVDSSRLWVLKCSFLEDPRAGALEVLWHVSTGETTVTASDRSFPSELSFGVYLHVPADPTSRATDHADLSSSTFWDIAIRNSKHSKPQRRQETYTVTVTDI